MQRSTQAIFDIADRGVIKLPAEITAARETAAAVAALDVDQPAAEHPLDIADRLAAETVAAAISGAAVNYGAIREAREAAELTEVRLAAIRGAQDRATAALDTAVRSNAEQIVRAMQPAFAKTVSQLKEALVLAAAWPDEAAALGAPAKIRATLASRFVLRAELDALAAARAALTAVGYRSERDSTGEFALVRNMDTLYPRPARQLRRPPWEADGDLVTWALANGGQLWLPTVSEQDREYDRAYRELEEEVAKNAAYVRALAGSFVGGGEQRYDPVTDGRPVRPAPRPAATNAAERLFAKPTDTDTN